MAELRPESSELVEDVDLGASPPDYDDDDDRRATGSLCSRVNWRLVKDYQPDPAVSWGAVSFARHAVWRTYLDPVVEAEFLRFMCREFIDLVFLAVWFGSNIGFSYLLGYPIGSYPFYVTHLASAFYGPPLLGSLYCHFVAPQTARWAWIKEKLLICVVFLCCISCSFPQPATPFYCDRGFDPFRWLAGQEQETITAERKQRFCVETVNPFPPVVSMLLFLIVRLRLHTALVLSVAYFVQLFAGYAPSLLPGRYEEWVIAQQVSFYLVAHAVALVLIGLRDQLLRQQFEQAISTHARTLALAEQQKRVDDLLCAMLPQSVLPRLMANQEVSDNTANATVMFSDVVSFTVWSASRTASEVVHLLNFICVRFDVLSAKHKVEKVKTIGDAYWAVAGLPIPREDHADVICLFALDCQMVAKSAARKHAKWADVKLRIGVHSGDLAGGILGRQSISYEVFGMTSHHAEQVEQAAEPGEVLVTAATRDELTEGVFELLPRPMVHLRGRTEPMAAFAVLPCFPTLRARGDINVDPERVSVVSSVRSASTHTSDGSSSVFGEEARLDRELFLCLTVLRGMPVVSDPAVTAVSAASAAKLVEEVSRRQHPFIILTFADAEVEAKFVAFTLTHQRRLRLAARWGLVVVCVTLIAMLLADVKRLTAVCAAILAPALLSSAVLVVGSSRGGTLNRWVDFVAFCGVCGGCCLGAGLMPRAVAANDITYLTPVLGGLLAVGLPTVPAFDVGVGYVLCIVVPNLTFAYTYAVYRATGIAFNLCGFILVFFAALLAERLSRKQFVENHVATLLQKGVERQRELQESLVASIVPRHVVGDLMAWFRDGRNIEKSIAQPLDVAVAFLQFVRSDVSPLARRTSAKEVMRLVRAVHDAADDELEKMKTHVAKIKTVGDIALLAGPFSGNVTLADAARALVVVAIRLRRRVAPNVSLRCGFHVGPVLGAVVGTDRLCYDIFGDTVNTASRAMAAATADEADLIATGAFVELFPSCGVSGSREVGVLGSDVSTIRHNDSGLLNSEVYFEFDGAVATNLKGKGQVALHLVRDVVVAE